MFASLLFAAVLAASTQSPINHSASFDVPSGQEIRMDLSAGEYEIVGGGDGRVRVTWSADDRYDADKVKVRFKTERGSYKLETDNTKNVHVVIQVPSQSHLYVRLSAGELAVSGIEGDKDIGLTAGELHIAVGDPANYKSVHSSVRIGEIHAKAFNAVKEGFFREINVSGNGAYALRATVGVGEVLLAR